MTRITVVLAGLLAGLLVALAVGLASGWVAFGGEAEVADGDADLACAGARALPEELPEDWGYDVVSRVVGVGALAQAAGSTGGGPTDLDDFGLAGHRLSRVVQTLDEDDYPDARRALVDACDER